MFVADIFHTKSVVFYKLTRLQAEAVLPREVLLKSTGSSRATAGLGLRVWRCPARLCSRERDRLALDVAATARVCLPVVHVDAVGLELLVPVPQGRQPGGRLSSRGRGEPGLQERWVVLPVCEGALLRQAVGGQAGGV